MARDKIAKDLDIIDKNQFAFAEQVDYPMYELDESSKKLSLAIFSMPQGDLQRLL